MNTITIKSLITIVVVAFFFSSSFAQTYTENFDNSAFWAGGSMTGYNAKTYINTGNPANDQFSTNKAVRETSYTHSSGYAFRVDDIVNGYLRYECEETINSFSVWMARWDNSPKPNVTIRYSTNSGTSYTTIETIDGDWFTGDKVYKQYTHTFSTAISPAAMEKVFIEFNTNSGERMMYDDFEMNYGAGTPSAATPTFTPPAGNYTTSQNVAISSSTPASTIRYTTDGTDPVVTSPMYTAPIAVSTTTTIKAIAYATGFDPSSVGTAEYRYPVEVADIASLRAGATDGTIYILTGEAILTFQTSSRNAKYIQDATGAILIDDASGTITTSYDIYDGITGIRGTLTSYHNMLQFIPSVDPGAATSSNNLVTPEEVTLQNLTSDYQAKLVKVVEVEITETGNFALSTNYSLSDASGSGTLRTAYSTLDYIGTPISTKPRNMTGVVLQYDSNIQLVPRSLSDITSVPVIPIGTSGIILAIVLIGGVLVVRKGKLF